MSAIRLRPCYRAEWVKWVPAVHRHHKTPPLQVVFAVAAEHAGAVVGVVLVEAPKARLSNDGTTLEVTRLALTGTHPRNAGSRLLGAAWRAAQAMGCERMISYTRTDEAGAVYRAASWHPVCETPPRSWPDERHLDLLPGIIKPASEPVARVRWEIGPGCRCEACETRRAA